MTARCERNQAANENETVDGFADESR